MENINHSNPTENDDNSILKDARYYIGELRQRLLRSFMAVFALFIVLCFFSNNLYQLLALPLIERLPQGSHLIATNITAPFLIPLKFAFVVSLVIAIPYLLHQLWSFIAPALYPRERRILWPTLFSSILLFYVGMLFAYFIVFPLVFGFFIQAAPSDVVVMPDISQYLSFCLKLFLGFGIAFEVPILTILLIGSGTMTAEKLIRGRPYVIVLAFIVGMLLTPPDVISQVLLALPMWLLYEVGILIGKRIYGSESGSSSK